MEDSETITTIRVGYIVVKLTEFLVLRADIGIKRWANRSFLQIVPIRVTI